MVKAVDVNEGDLGDLARPELVQKHVVEGLLVGLRRALLWQVLLNVVVGETAKVGASRSPCQSARGSLPWSTA